MTDAIENKGLKFLFSGIMAMWLVIAGLANYAEAGSPTIIGGRITEDMVLTLDSSPYRITKNLIVPQDIKLIIEAGVEIVADMYMAIIVEGNLHAIGTKDNWIKMTSTKIDEKWDGIKLKNDSFDYNSDELIEGHGVTIEFCRISLARTGVNAENCNPSIRKNKFIKNDDGIMCLDYASPLIENNVFKDNTIAIECVNFASPIITHNTIVGLEGKGIRCENHSSPRITYNTIFGEGKTWWKGLVVLKSSQPTINFNNIYANGGYNLMMVKIKTGDKSLPVSAENNWWGISDLESIAKSIREKSDRAELGEVDFDPFSENRIASAKHKY